MSFGSPVALVALAIVPLAVAAYVLNERRRTRDAAAFASPPLLPNLVSAAPGWRRHVPPALLGLAVVAFLLGLGRPHARITERSDEATAIVAIDASRSMGATDVPATRLARAQAIARRFVDQLPGSYRASVVAFGSRAQVTAAPTLDRAVARSAIASLRVGTATALGDAIALAVRVARGAGATHAGEGHPPAAVLVISDGAQDGGSVSIDAAVRRATGARVPVFTGVLGTPSGVVSYRHPEGYVERIQVPPDPAALRAVAQRTGGRFFADPTTADLRPVYDDLAKRRVTVHRDEEITYAFAAGGAALLLAGGLLGGAWFRRVV
jgi:Ca-activated chloride channel family protein